MLYPVIDHPERVTKYVPNEGKLNWTGINFPATIKDVVKFERRNPDVSICAYKFDGKFPRPIHVSNRMNFDVVRHTPALSCSTTASSKQAHKHTRRHCSVYQHHPCRGFPPPGASHPQCRPGDLPAFKPRQVQQEGRVLFYPQVLGHRLWWRPLRQSLPTRPHQWPSELQRAHTTLRRSNFEHELRLHPDKAWVTWLLDGIDNGVSIGYTGSVSPLRSCNLSSAHAHPDVVDAELEKEITAGWIIGPFAKPPLHNLRTSGVGVVPKKDGKWRAILHLSALDGHSVNDHINKEDFPVHYSSVDDAVALLSQYGQDALMAKIDLKAAFRLIPVQAADWVHLGICWRGHFCVDTCLPFGLRSAPALFNHYAEALDWIMANNYGAQLLHYLDDFLLVGPPGEDTCQEAMSRMLTVCDQLGIPVASEKLEGPTTALTFLGIVLDTSAQQLRLPPGQARGADRANQVLAIQAQGHQEGAALTHRQALLCC